MMKSEIDLAQELGMERKIIRGIRQERLNADAWTKLGNHIVYTETGEHALRNAIQLMLSAEELSEPLPVLSPQEFKICHIPLNPRLVIGVLVVDGDTDCTQIKIRVRDNKNFLKNMTLKARPPAEGSTTWVMMGRCPRWRGKY